MNIERNQNSDQTSTISITLTPEDYLPKYKAELNKLKGKVNLKGFRKGKVPTSVLEGYYGMQALAELVEKEFSSALDSYLKENDLKILVQPLTDESQDMIDLNYKDKKKEYTYKYVVGEMPEFEVPNIDSDNKYTYYVVDVAQEEIDQQMNDIAKRYGSIITVDEDIKINDILNVSAVEMDGDKPKKDGWMSSFPILTDSITDEEIKKTLLSLKKGGKFVADIHKVTNRDPDTIRKSLLKVEEGDDREIGDVFEYTIEKVERLQPMELTDENVAEKLDFTDTVEGLQDFVKKSLAESREGSAKSILYRDIMDRIMENVEISLPEQFLKRWLKEVQNVEESNLDKEYTKFESEYRWTLVKEKLSKDYDVEVDPQEIQAGLRAKASNFARQYGMMDPAIIDQMYQRLSQDQNEVYNVYTELQATKIFEQIEDKIVKEEKKVDEHELKVQIDLRNQTSPFADEEE